MRRTRPALLAAAAAAAALAAGAVPAAGADGVLTGGAIPRLEPFTARAVPCGGTSCLDIAWRVRGEIGPRLRWHLTVTRPGGDVVYAGGGRSARGRRVSGLLRPSEPPVCGRHRVSLTVVDAGGDHIEGAVTAIRRTRCAPPR
ncbi:MAG: hypothetical protein AB7V62_09525 [Thermoleophilia bacterium]